MTKAYTNYTKKRETILLGAEKLFFERGYSGTSMDAVASEAQVTKQTVYRYFSSKADLFSALIEKDKEEEKTFTFEDGKIFEELLRYAEAFTAAHLTQKRIEMYRIMLCESRHNAEIGAIFSKQAQPRWKKTLATFFENHLHLSESTDHADMFNALLLFLRPQIIMRLHPLPDEKERKRHALRAVHIFLTGIEAPFLKEGLSKR